MSHSTFPHGCKRPLPPPQSRQSVLRQSRQVSWTVANAQEDLLISNPRKRVRSDDESFSHAVHRPDSSLRNRINNVRTNDHRSVLKARHPVQLANGVSEKRGLFSSEEYRTQLARISRAETATRSTQSPLPIRSSNRPSTGFAENQKVEDDQEEALRLAKITNKDVIYVEGIESQTPKHQERRRMAQQFKEDDRECELENRSRQLREKALARRFESTLSEISETASSRIFRPASDLSDIIARPQDSVNAAYDLKYEQQSYTPSETVGDEVPDRKRTASPDIGNLFAIATEAAIGSSHSWLEPQSTPSGPEGVLSGPHPSSRAAAELYRTQNRHLSTGSEAIEAAPRASFDLERSEQRLRALTSRSHHQGDTFTRHFLEPSNTGCDQTPIQTDSKARLSRESSHPSPSSILLPKPMHAAASSEAVEPCVGEEQDSSLQLLPDTSTGITEAADKEAFSSKVLARFPPLRAPKQVLSCPQVEPALNLASEASKPPSKYTEKPTELVLPKNFNRYSDELKEAIVECETLKDRKRDLEVILPAFKHIARLGALDQFSDMENEEIRTVQEYTRAVVDKGLSGKLMRARVQGIRQNMTRRANRISSEDEPQDESSLPVLLKPERREHIKQLLEDVKNTLERSSFLRGELMSKWHSKRSKKSRFQSKRTQHPTDLSEQPHDSSLDVPKNTEIVFPDPDIPKPRKLTVTERKRNARLAALDKREAILRANLAKFELQASSNTINSDDGHTSLQHAESASEISEEDEGAELFSKPASTPILDNTLPLNSQYLRDKGEALQSNEDNQNDHDTNTHGASRQAMHDDLASSTQKKHDLPATLGQQRAQVHDVSLVSSGREIDEAQAEPSEFLPDHDEEHEFADLDTSRPNGDHRCYRYTVKFQCVGVPGFEQDNEYVLDNYLHRTEALKAIKTMMQQVRDWYYESLSPSEEFVVHEDSIEDQEADEFLVELGRDGRISCRSWVIKDEYSPSAEAYKHAKVNAACHAAAIYTVYWKRTVQPVLSHPDEQTKVEEDTGIVNTNQQLNPVSEHGLNDADLDEALFGIDLPDPNDQIATSATEQATSGPPPPTVTEIQTNALRYFTNIANANRHAKIIFMRWYMDHMQGSHNFIHIRETEQTIEEQLESYGNRTTWDRQATFDVFVDNDDDGTESNMRLAKTDTYKVWVIQLPVLGPAN